MFHFRALLLGCLLLLLPCVSFAADPPAPDPSPVSHTIAVADFSGADPDMGRFIAETLLTDLAESRSLHFAERSEIRRALDELKLQSTGLIDSQQIAQLGKLVSADRLIVGSYFEAGDQVIINARLLDVETGRLAEGGSGNVSGDRRNLLSLVHRLAHQFHRRITGDDFVIDGEGAEPRTQPFTPNTPTPSTSHLDPTGYRIRPVSNNRPIRSAQSVPSDSSSPQQTKQFQPHKSNPGYRVKELASDPGSTRLVAPRLAPPPVRLDVPKRRYALSNSFHNRPLKFKPALILINPPLVPLYSWRVQ